jgi:signal transduction histidine kinase
MTSLRRQLNPRLHIAAAIGWAVFGVVTLAALIAANLASNQAERRARADAEGLLAEFATQVRDALSMGLETRRSLLLATAAQIASTADSDPAALRQTLRVAQSQFPEFSRLAVADATGRVLADTKLDTDEAATHANVSATPWFQHGRQAPFVSDVHAASTAGTAGTAAPAAREGPPLRLIDVAVPLRKGGVLGAFLDWTWVEQQVVRMQQALNKNRQVELLLVARDGTVLAGPPDWSGRSLASDRDATQGGSYVIGSRAYLRLADGLGLGWTVIVRQRAERALAPARTTGRTVFLIVFVAGLLAAGLAALATRLLTRRLTRLAVDAEAVRQGESRLLAAPAGADEVSRIGATLSQVVGHLQSEKQALQTLNRELDHRVAERTQRIERMADEARHAAVTRERLRIARDLHDTLAHSLMALLTQIRLVRKLRGRMAAAELDEELGRAEDVATTGLAESRAAIAQMRDNGVRDTGLGAAVQDLARRFSARTGLAVNLQTDAAVAKSTDERAEAVFRIVEEALRNVERHAGAQRVRVGLRSVPAAGHSQRVTLEVADDGVGFDPALPRPGHFGLRGIQEQAALIGAQFSVISQPGQGTQIVLAFDTPS